MLRWCEVLLSLYLSQCAASYFVCLVLFGPNMPLPLFERNACWHKQQLVLISQMRNYSYCFLFTKSSVTL